jgi:N-formylglutamate amidohydrolase
MAIAPYASRSILPLALLILTGLLSAGFFAAAAPSDAAAHAAPSAPQPGAEADEHLLAVTAPAHEAAKRLAELVASSDLVTAQRGQIPVILVAPHGGLVRIPGVPDRKAGVTVTDTGTAELALLISQRVTAKLGGKPYLVVAQFVRKNADANRPAAEAFEADAARPHYEAFHAAARAAVDECRTRFGGAILIDVHGQARVPDAIVRGTRNGKTVSRLLERSGAEALTGPDSIPGRLAAAGYQILPVAEDGPAGEPAMGRETFFDGGFIVASYGSHNANGVDAIQLEFGKMRRDDPIKLARDVGDAIAAFVRRYGPQKSDAVGK